MLEHRSVKDAKFDFTPLLCAQIIWAVIEDSRQFFFTSLHPDDFVPGARPRFPISLLAWINQSVMMQSPINMNPRFPQRWAVAAATRDQTRKQMDAGQSSMEGMWNGAASARWGAQQPPPAPAPAIKIPPPAPQQWNPPAGAPPSAQGGSAASTAHPAFAFTAPLIARTNGHIAVGKALSLIGKTFSDLPKLAGYATPEGISKICWVHVITGRCPYGEKCRHPQGHVPLSAMTNDFVQLAVALLQPAVEMMMNTPAPVKKKRKPAG